MEFLRLPISAMAMVMLVLHLFLFPLVHAHGLALVEPGRPHASDIVCFAADVDAGHDSTESHNHNSGICHPDTPCVVTDIQSHAVKPLIIDLSSSYAGRLLPGHPRPLYIPPRGAV
ncbi:hypothetical protein KI811_06015 [Geobacter hydrogenophilus]|uniref:hypothetical protein n=1 Tax=Geobacter hydrogenophilus TaxID=40983 RepID=UPI001BD9D9DF|nr:hypothetical protein [Geobacter hydrogenophilus]MBT0893363.1 hypothetical protein [Geobacter hydrogenophilus]